MVYYYINFQAWFLFKIFLSIWYADYFAIDNNSNVIAVKVAYTIFITYLIIKIYYKVKVTVTGSSFIK